MSILVLTSDTLIGTPATGNLEYNGQFFGTDSNASRAQLQRLVLETAKASTSGTSVDFTGIPAWVKKITVMFNGVSTNGSNQVLLQLGAGSIDTASYNATIGIIITSTPSTGANTAGFPLGGVDPANIRSGIMQIATLGSNIWVASAVIKGGTGTMSYIAGDKTLSGTLDRLRIIGGTTGTPTDTFDAGSINILYEG